MLSDARLDKARLTGDSVADHILSAVYPEGREGVRALSELMNAVQFNETALPPGTDPLIEAFLSWGSEVGHAEGGWDERKLAVAAELHRNYTLHIPFVLQFATMPLLYAAAHGAAVLSFTERLEKYAQRRSIETAQMVQDVMDPAGFTPGGRAWRSAQRTRLMHSAVRHMALTSGRWDAGVHGVPINQEDLLGTLFAFSILVLDGLAKLGAVFSPEEEEAYYYRWRAVGALIGIEQSLIPDNVADARALFDHILERQIRASVHGQRLVRAWFICLEEMLPGDSMDHLVPSLIAHMCPPSIGKALDLDDSIDIAEAMEKLAGKMSWFDGRFSRGSIARRGINAIANGMYNAVYVAQRGVERHRLSLPESVAHRWHLPGEAGTDTEDHAVSTRYCDFFRSLPLDDQEVLLSTVPRVLSMVAHADGSFDPLERRQVRRVLDEEVEKELGDDFRWSWAARRATQELYAGVPDHEADTVWLDRLARIVAQMPPHLSTHFRHTIDQLCLHVARASSSALLWFGTEVSEEEQHTIERIVSTLHIEHEAPA